MARRPSPQTAAVLAALAREPEEWRYGYELGKEVGLEAGTLYPILMRLSERGLLEAGLGDRAAGRAPAAALYRITGEGERAAAEAAAAARAASAPGCGPHDARSCSGCWRAASGAARCWPRSPRSSDPRARRRFALGCVRAVLTRPATWLRLAAIALVAAVPALLFTGPGHSERRRRVCVIAAVISPCLRRGRARRARAGARARRRARLVGGAAALGDRPRASAVGAAVIAACAAAARPAGRALGTAFATCLAVFVVSVGTYAALPGWRRTSRRPTRSTRNSRTGSSPPIPTSASCCSPRCSGLSSAGAPRSCSQIGKVSPSPQG